LAQRPGPATGLPTRTEQGDLNLVLYAGHGEFPRAILAPADISDCATLAARGVHLAEESQGPVFLLTDQFLSDCLCPTKPFECSSFEASLNPLDIHGQNEAALNKNAVYERYRLGAEDGLSPRLLPGFSKHLVKQDSDEHTPNGHITEDLNWRVKMQDKRMKKLAWLRSQTLPPQYYGDSAADLIMVTWGSTLGAGLDALDEMKILEQSAGLLHFRQLYPLNPAEWLPRLEKAAVVFIEGNFEGQFAALVRRETGFKPHKIITRYDGLPITATYIMERLEA
jgi:2-oxoglutarate ferredoxin oxidoreductase subunit alpha